MQYAVASRPTLLVDDSANIMHHTERPASDDRTACSIQAVERNACAATFNTRGFAHVGLEAGALVKASHLRLWLAVSRCMSLATLKLGSKSDDSKQSDTELSAVIEPIGLSP